MERHNRLSLNDDGLSPLERFSRTADDIIPTNFHTWGCPVFVLDAANQSGTIGTPKWEPRSHTGVFPGHSPSHAGSVALVLHLRTGLVNPQFHLVFDDEFSTVPYLTTSLSPPNWFSLLHHSTEKTTSDQQLKSEQWLYSSGSPHQMVSDPRPTSFPPESSPKPAPTSIVVSEGAPLTDPRETVP